MIYIKRQSTSLLLALASLSVVSSSLMSCSESMGISGVTLSDKKISFTATEVNGWTPNSGSRSNDETTRAIGSYHPLLVKSDLGKPLYLHPVEQVGTYFYNDKDELVTRSGVPLSEISNQNSISTRGTKVTEIGDEILVSAVSKKYNVEAGYFPFEKATKSGSIWHISKDEYWTTDASLSFYAYAPTNASMLSTSDSELSGYRTVHYVAGTGDDIKSQPDFIVAKSEDNSCSATDAAKAVNLHFSHALTAITFSVGNDMVLGTVKSVAIRNVKGKGDYDISTGQWTLSSDLSDYEIPLGTDGNGIGIETGVAKALTTDPLTLMMIPQKFEDNSTTEVEIVFDNGAGERTLSAELKGTEWKAGYTINYKLSANSITTLNMGDVTFPTSWSSNINATATNKIKSAYANGDQIGLFVVDENNKVSNANIAITYNGTSWTLPNGETYKFSPQYTYFAYYPYQSSLTGLPAVNATVDVSDATTFFSDAISTWETNKLVSDQSTLAKLDACDLQIGKATFDNTASKINFASMNHAMGLADMTRETKTLPHRYTLSGYTSYTWTNGSTTVTASNSLEDSRKLYDVSSTRGVIIVPPTTTATSFNSTSIGNDAWSEAVSIIAASNAIGTGTAKLKLSQIDYSYTMAVGDIYYSDGAMTHQSEDLASDKTPVGVVGYIAKSGDDYWVEKNTKATGIGGHALVMGLKTIGSKSTTDRGTRYQWRTTNSNPGSPAYVSQTGAMIRASSDKTYGSGYSITKAYWENKEYPAFCGVNEYNTTVPVSNKSTGWFMASAGQYYAVFTQLGDGGYRNAWEVNDYMTDAVTIMTNINSKFAKVGSNNYTQFFQGTFYGEWTTSINNKGSLCDIVLDNYAGSTTLRFNRWTFSGGNNVETRGYVRPFLAF